jgi:hypothetical protein
MEHSRLLRRRNHRSERQDGREQVEALARFPLFAGCTRAELARIDALTYELDVPAGRVLTREGEPASQVLFVTAGWGRATRGAATVGSYEPGSCIGGADCAAGSTNADTVTSETTVTLLAASAREFRSLTDIPAIARLAEMPVVSAPAVYEPATSGPVPVTVPATSDPDGFVWRSAGWLAYARSAEDEPWPPFANAVEGARTFDAGGLAT